jgi:hypothetical protein
VALPKIVGSLGGKLPKTTRLLVAPLYALYSMVYSISFDWYDFESIGRQTPKGADVDSSMAHENETYKEEKRAIENK